MMHMNPQVFITQLAPASATAVSRQAATDSVSCLTACYHRCNIRCPARHRVAKNLAASVRSK